MRSTVDLNMVELLKIKFEYKRGHFDPQRHAKIHNIHTLMTASQ